MCKNCQSRPVYEFTNKRKLCSECFVRYFQKKVFYTIRKFGMIKQNELVEYENTGDVRSVVLEDVLRIFAKKANVKLVNKKNKNAKKIAISSTLDLEADKIAREIIKGSIKKLEVKPVDRKMIKPLFLFLDKEVLLYARIRKLKFKKSKEKSSKISKFVDELEIKHPEIKRAIVNGWLKIHNQI